MSAELERRLYEKYGPRLDMDQLAEFMNITRSTLDTKVSRDTMPLATYKEGKRRYCNTTVLAAYLSSREATPA
jgi:hypothetical protein